MTLFQILSEPFMLRALWAGCFAALATATLGCFVFWRKTAYFGDAVSHAALLGAPLAFALGVNAGYSAVLVCGAFALLFSYLQNQRIFPNDSALGILAHTCLSAALTAVSLLKIPNFDLHGFLFGDILTVTRQELPLITGAALLTVGSLYYYRRELMLMTVSEELAAVEGVPVKRLNLMLTLLTALTVGVAVRIVGALLIVALLVIPPAAARFFSRSPGGMAFRSVLISLISVIAGVSLSAELNIPAGPAVILTASTVFFLLFFAERIGGRNK